MEGTFNIYTISMIVVFSIGYLLITLEHITHINKTTIALLMAIICWILQFGNHYSHVTPQENLLYLNVHIANISQVVFFLLGALSVVELINAHQGFKIISDIIQVQSKHKILWVLGFITFFLSSVLDNLTTTIVMVSLVKKLLHKREDRWLIGGSIVIAANAGGAWTPIGDVTTTMLWIGGQISSGAIIKGLFLPSMVCFVASFFIIHWMIKGEKMSGKNPSHQAKIEPMGHWVFFLGIGSLVFVPVFKMLTGLPPFMGILFGLGVLWLFTDVVHDVRKEYLRVPHVLTKIDLSGVLFFFGILLCINALETAQLLEKLAHWLDRHIGSTTAIATMIGIASAIVDNVPLVAATMGMYSLEQYPQDSAFWQLIAYCAGTGGSMLIIGSAAGVVFMGLEKVDFFWYLKNISFAALVGYFAGIGVFILFM
jgi:NhaD family Na+/H+ antiporter